MNVTTGVGLSVMILPSNTAGLFLGTITKVA